ncbi:hypothetical protein BJ085DRAFT_36717 [Dimargaris cristalligena]|uniref:DNA polymerase delta, subunit 4-domain-containing protein n=1 Tax=Dimargaris cristalligena TaxID=215637 RepID=A0A4P9ZZK6_9FUNG|nr:hypothetical protein BJ085DRAFT_36717 [Dimargaris cristalligena]|eukprot:RKP38551.1 hypothetical protein BJ085DRAFT_36717 [Dimargaris cristalligena]
MRTRSGLVTNAPQVQKRRRTHPPTATPSPSPPPSNIHEVDEAHRRKRNPRRQPSSTNISPVTSTPVKRKQPERPSEAHYASPPESPPSPWPATAPIELHFSPSAYAEPDPVGHKQANSGARDRVNNQSDRSQHPETRQDELELLGHFDLKYTYGPCIGLTRLHRWDRASRLGLQPPPLIRDILMDHRKRDDPHSSIYAAFEETIFNGRL